MPRPPMKVRKSTTGPWSCGVRFRDPTHSTETTVLPARSAAWPMWSAWRMPFVAKLVELLKFPSPVRWNVLFVEPCSPGQVPVESVYQPTPVFGGNPGLRPFLPVTPDFMRELIVGMAPCLAYLSTRSGLMPSEAKKMTGVPPGPAGGVWARPAPTDIEPATSSVNVRTRAASTVGRKRLPVMESPSPGVDDA